MLYDELYKVLEARTKRINELKRDIQIQKNKLSQLKEKYNTYVIDFETEKAETIKIDIDNLQFEISAKTEQLDIFEEYTRHTDKTRKLAHDSVLEINQEIEKLQSVKALKYSVIVDIATNYKEVVNEFFLLEKQQDELAKKAMNISNEFVEQRRNLPKMSRYIKGYSTLPLIVNDDKNVLIESIQ